MKLSTMKPWASRLGAVCLLLATVPWASGQAAARSVAANRAPSIVIAVLQQPLDPGMPVVGVQLRRFSTTGAAGPVLRSLTSYSNSLDLSKDGRRLVYTDRQFQLHLVTLTNGRDQVLGKGIWARFSVTGRYLAYLTGSIMPVVSPGPQGRIKVYDLITGRSSRVGPKDPLLSDFAWSPRSDRLVWQLHLLKGGAVQQRPDPMGPLWIGVASAASPGAATFVRPPGRLGDLVVPGKSVEVRNDGSPTWSADGKSVLYWRFLQKEASTDTYRWQLVSWRLPGGPARVLWTVRAALPNDQIPPPPVVSASTGVVASLLGGPQHDFTQLALYFPAGGRTRTVKLPGEARQVSFSPNGRQPIAVWDGPLSGQSPHVVRRAALVDVATGKIRDLGPALQAFWCDCG